jgi:hypothetical protein
MSDKANFLYCLDAELRYAQAKFPKTENCMVALTEEVGELAKALLDHSYGKGEAKDVYAEAVQVAAMAMRVALEGDTCFPYRYAHSHYQAFNVNKKTVKALNVQLEALSNILDLTNEDDWHLVHATVRKDVAAGILSAASEQEYQAMVAEKLEARQRNEK